MTRPEGLNKKTIADLGRLCEYLDALCKEINYPQLGGEKVVDTTYWLKPEWKAPRQYADCIFHVSGCGWRLREHWRERLAQLEAELIPDSNPDDAVLGSQPPPQPRSDDAVLGGQSPPQSRPDDAVLGG